MTHPETAGELSPEDALVQEAAAAFWRASWEERGDPERRLYHRTAFVVISGMFAPRAGDFGRPVEQTNRQLRVWQEYAAQQYEAATGEPLALAQSGFKTWKVIARLAGRSFQMSGRYEPDDNDFKLATALLYHHPGITFDPNLARLNPSDDASEEFAPDDRTSGQNLRLQQ
jgi:hypothetical protein